MTGFALELRDGREPIDLELTREAPLINLVSEKREVEVTIPKEDYIELQIAHVHDILAARTLLVKYTAIECGEEHKGEVEIKSRPEQAGTLIAVFHS